jgi:SCP-2 sterol transfer family protein
VTGVETISTADWAAAREAVAQAGPRLTAMLRAARRPEAVALGEWDITGVATHISHGMDTITAMSRGGGNLLEDISGLSTLTKVMVAGEGRRPLGELADRIDASVGGFLAATIDAAAAGDDSSHAWIVQGTVAPLSFLTCHMLNELTMHGRDIALAEGVPWPIDRGHASLIMQGFVLPSLHTLGRAMVVQDKAGNARFEVRLRGDGRTWMVFADGNFSVESAPQGKVDCHLSVDPEAFLLVAWGRVSQWPAIGKGQLLAWGRKPWLGMQMRSWLRNP